MKICKNCKENKSLDDFYKIKERVRYICKKCSLIKTKAYKDKIRKMKPPKEIFYGPEYKRTCTKCNVEKIISGNFNRHIRQPFGIAIWCKQCSNLCDKKRRCSDLAKARAKEKDWQNKNKAWVNSYKRAWAKRKSLKNKSEKLNSLMRSKLKYSIASEQKQSKFLDFTSTELKNHLESKFTKGMSWANYGYSGWHIDHIIPLSFFEYKGDKNHPAFKAAWSLSNLQPLWATTEIAMSYGEDKNYIGNLDKRNNIKITKEIKLFLKSVNTENNDA